MGNTQTQEINYQANRVLHEPIQNLHNKINLEIFKYLNLNRFAEGSYFSKSNLILYDEDFIPHANITTCYKCFSKYCNIEGQVNQADYLAFNQKMNEEIEKIKQTTIQYDATNENC